MTRPRRRPVTAQVCPGGPLLLRGADTVRDADGVDHDVTRPVAAVCLCGRTQSGPWCDGTHKFLNRSDGTEV